MSEMPDLMAASDNSFDWASAAANLSFPSFDFSIPADISVPWVTAPTNIQGSGSILQDFSSIAGAVGSAAHSFFGTQAQIAHDQATVAVEKAKGQNAVQVARAGLPSPQFLIIAGLGLVGVLVLSKRR